MQFYATKNLFSKKKFRKKIPKSIMLIVHINIILNIKVYSLCFVSCRVMVLNVLAYYFLRMSYYILGHIS